MVDVTPYEHEGHNYDALNIIVAYRKGQGFVITWQPVKREPMGYMTGPMPSRDILVSGAGFVVKEASRNNVKVLEQMRTNLEVGAEGIRYYFDQRLWPALRTFMGDVANYGYTPKLQNEINELINNSKSSTTMATLKIKKNESANVQNNAQVSNPEMTKQYKQMKEKNPNAILLFRCGDFYETYFEDAADAAEVLGITLTKKGDMPLAGFPYHALDQYMPKLIRAGKRVAICDALESEELRVKSEESATAAEPANVNDNDNENDNANDNAKDKAVTVPLGEHGTLIIGKPGLTPSNSPRGEQEPEPISEQPANDNANDNANANADEVIVDVTTPLPAGEGQGERLCSVEFSTYTTKKGNTAPQIIGFGGENDPRWQSHKDAGHKYVSASWKKDLNGEKVYILMFGVRYMDVAKALAGAYNTNDREAWKRAEDACMAIYEQAQRDGKARWEAKKAEWKQKADERKAKKEADRKCYTKEDVAAMLNDLLAGKDIPEDVKKLLKAA